MSNILRNSTRFIASIMLLISVLLVLRGHNYPGGGFIGALVACGAIGLYALAFGIKATGFSRWIVKLVLLALVLLLVALLLPLYFHQPLLTGMWFQINIGVFAFQLGTPLLFDFGVYFLVIAAISSIIVELEDKQ